MVLAIDLGGTNLCLGLVDNSVVINMTSVPSFPTSATMEQTLEYLREKFLFKKNVDKLIIDVRTSGDIPIIGASLI